MKIMILILIICIFLSILVTNLIKFPEEETKVFLINQTYQEVLEFEPDYIISKTYKIQLELMPILEQNANEHTYELHIYDCTQFSENLVKKLTNLGFKAECIGGRYLGETNYPDHTWVSVEIEGEEFPIEATGGYFIDTEDYKNYKVYKKGYCW